MRKLLMVIGSVLALFILALVVAPFFISEDVLKSHLVAKFEEVSGKKLTIGGAFKLKLFPLAGVHMEDVTLADKDDAKPMVALKSLNVDVELIPIFSGNVVVKSLALESPQIRLISDASGKGNWEPPAAAGSQPAPAKSTSPSAPAVKNLQLSGVKVTNGSVHYEDRKTGSAWDIAKLNLDTSLDGLDSPLKAEGSVEWNGKLLSFDVTATTLRSLLANEKTGIDLAVDSDIVRATAHGNVASQRFSGPIEINVTSVDNALRWLNPGNKKSGLPPDTVFSLKGESDCGAESCQMQNLALVFGKIVASGGIKANLAGDVPVIDAKLSIPELDITPFLPPQDKVARNSLVSNAYAEADWSKDPIDLSALRTVNGNFNLDIGSIRIWDIKIGKTPVQAKLQSGVATVNVPSMSFYEGNGSMTAIVDARSDTTKIERSVALKGLNLEAFLKDALHSDRFSGTAEMEVTAGTQGKSVYDFVSALQGKGAIKVVDGAIKGYNIADMVRNVQSAFKQVDTSSKKTDFAELSGTFTINDGIFINNDLSMKAPLMRLAGAGTVNLPLQTLNYRLVPQFADTLKGQGSDKQGIGIPVIVEGSLNNPQFKPDVRAIAEDVIKNPDAYKEKAKEIKSGFKELKGLFKKPKQPAAVAAPAEPVAPAAPPQPSAPAR